MIISYFIFYNLLFATPSLAEPGCAEKIQLASASSWNNLVNSKDSLKYKTAKLINNAIKDKQNAEIILTTTPNKISKEYEDRDYCEKKLQQTTANNKLVYNSAVLNSSAAVNDWLSGLSQGKSPEGVSLYKKCDRSCSPSYEYIITLNDGKFNIKASVSCGHARDKNDNKYKLSAKCSS